MSAGADISGLWLRGQDLNLGPSGYEPDELPGCSTPRQSIALFYRFALAGAVLVKFRQRRTAAAKPKGLGSRRFERCEEEFPALCRPGNDLLSHVLRHSTIGAKAFDGRVRDGIGSYHFAEATRPTKGRNEANIIAHQLCPKGLRLFGMMCWS